MVFKLTEEKRKYFREYKARWAKANPEKYEAIKKRYYPKQLIRNKIWRLKRKGLDCDWTFDDWQALLDKHGRKCLKCKKPDSEVEITIDHVIPIHLGGTNLLDNLQPLCRSCNSSKSATIVDYRDAVQYK